MDKLPAFLWLCTNFCVEGLHPWEWCPLAFVIFTLLSSFLFLLSKNDMFNLYKQPHLQRAWTRCWCSEIRALYFSIFFLLSTVFFNFMQNSALTIRHTLNPNCSPILDWASLWTARTLGNTIPENNNSLVTSSILPKIPTLDGVYKLLLERSNKGGPPDPVLTTAGRSGIARMAGERSVSGRAVMGIVVIPPMVAEAWFAMVVSEAKGGACGMQYANCHWQLMGMIEWVWSSVSLVGMIGRDVWHIWRDVCTLSRTSMDLKLVPVFGGNPI